MKSTVTETGFLTDSAQAAIMSNDLLQALNSTAASSLY
jgi:hypothetical protein